MWIIDLAVRRPVTVIVIVFLIVLFGIIGGMRIPVQLTPNVDQPVVTVTTRWFGADPQEVVEDVIKPQEEVLKSVSGLQEMTATAQPGQGEIRLQFAVGANKEAALNEVRDKLRQVRQYPDDVTEPVIQSVDSSARDFIAWFMVRPSPNSPDRTGDGRPDPIPSDGTNAPGFSGEIRELGDFFEDEVKPILERAGGVEQVNIYGGRQREMQVRVDLERLAARGLGIDQVTSVLRQNNQDVTAGTVEEGKRSISVRVTGRYDNPEAIASTVIAFSDTGTPVFVRDIADVEIGYKKEVSFVRSKGVPVIAIPVLRETGSNVLVVMANLKEAVQDVNENVLGARGWGIELQQVYDQTIYIRSAVGQARWNLAIGGLLAAVVLLATLRSFGATAVIVLAIPIATIGTLLGMAVLGRSLNVISMAGLTFAVGMGIDNAIVVLENIFRHREMGKNRVRAAVEGAGEVWGAIVASTLTNVAVFLPVVFIQQEAGQLFRDISIALTISFFLYLFVAPTVIPMLAAQFLRKMPPSFRTQTGEAVRSRTIFGRIGAGSVAISDWFYRLILWLTRGVVVRLAIVVVLVGAALGVSYFLIPPRDYLPAGNQNLFMGFVLPPPGYNVDEYRDMARHVEASLAPWWDVDASTEEGRRELRELQAAHQQQVEQYVLPGMRAQLEQRIAQLREEGLPPRDIAAMTSQQRAVITSMEAGAPPPAIDNFFFVNFLNFVFMGASSQDPQNVAPLSGLLNGALAGIPGTRGFFFQAPIFQTEGFAGGNSITLRVVGARNEEVIRASGAVMGQLIEVFNDFPRPEPANFNLGRPELRIEPDRERAGLARVPWNSVLTMGRVAVDGEIIGDYRYGGRTIDLTVLSNRPRARTFVDQIGNVPLATRDGGVVPLSSVTQLVSSTAPQQIDRVEQQSSIAFTINLPPGVSIGEASDLVSAQVEEPLRQAGVLGPGIRLQLTGSANKLQDFMGAFIPGFFLAAIVTYLLLSALLESFIYPIVIILSVPFAMAGGFLGLAILHWADPRMTLNVLTMLGFVILIGTIVNNPILIVYQALNFWRAGLPRQQAIARSAQTRVRPILISVTTTLAGLSPLVIFAGPGSELYRGLGAVLVGGLAVSTVLTLILTPTLMSLLMDFMALFRADPHGQSPTPPPPAPRREKPPEPVTAEPVALPEPVGAA